MSRIKKWDEEWLFKSYHEEEMTMEEMAEEAGVSTSTIRRQMRLNGIPTFMGRMGSGTRRARMKHLVEFWRSMGWDPYHIEVVYGITESQQEALVDGFEGYL